jgi:uncharacterized protein (DUF488 family)
MRVSTIGHGTRTVDELIATLQEARVETLVDVRRFPGSRRNPHCGDASPTLVVRGRGATPFGSNVAPIRAVVLTDGDPA